MIQFTITEIKQFRKRGLKNPLVDYYNVSLIYKFIINNKIYIGQTYNLKSRLNSYFSSKNIQLIQRAISKHKEGVFKIIEICKKEELDEKEIYWIKYFNSNNLEVGYNLTTGGQFYSVSNSVIQKQILSAKNKKQVSIYNLEGALVETFCSVRECARKLNVTSSTIFNNIKTKNVLVKKYLVCYGNNIYIEKYKGKNTKAISKAMQNNKHCLKYKWKAINNNIEYFADSVRHLSIQLNIKEETVRSIVYGRTKNSSIIITKEKI